MKIRSEILFYAFYSSPLYIEWCICRIWRQARRNHYPGLPETLPLGLDEYELFDLTTGKGCDYCETKKKVRPYYIWSVRCCQV